MRGRSPVSKVGAVWILIRNDSSTATWLLQRGSWVLIKKKSHYRPCLELLEGRRWTQGTAFPTRLLFMWVDSTKWSWLQYDRRWQIMLRSLAWVTLGAFSVVGPSSIRSKILHFFSLLEAVYKNDQKKRTNSFIIWNNIITSVKIWDFILNIKCPP